jgi:hypothetical protein
MNTNEMNTNEMNVNDWFKQPLEPINLNDLRYIPGPQETPMDWHVTRSTVEYMQDADYIAPLKKTAEEDTADDVDDYEMTYATMDPMFEMLFKPLDDPLFQPTPHLEELDERLSQMYYNSIENE